MIRFALIFASFAVPAQAETFVSLAFDQQSAIYGFATADTAELAQKQAFEVCSAQHALHCKVNLTRTNKCVALAIDYSAGGYGTFSAPTEEAAKAGVLPHCESFGNENCQIVETICPTN